MNVQELNDVASDMTYLGEVEVVLTTVEVFFEGLSDVVTIHHVTLLLHLSQ